MSDSLVLLIEEVLSLDQLYSFLSKNLKERVSINDSYAKNLTIACSEKDYVFAFKSSDEESIDYAALLAKYFDYDRAKFYYLDINGRSCIVKIVESLSHKIIAGIYSKADEDFVTFSHQDLLTKLSSLNY